MKEKLKKENRQNNLLFQRKAQIEAKVEEYKKKKKDEYKKKQKKIKELKEKKKEEIQIIQEKFSKVQEKRKQQEEEKLSKLKERQNKMKEKNEKRDKELIEFYHKQRKRIKIQIKDIMKKRKEYLYKFKEKKDEKIKPSPKPSYLDKDKEYITFESNLIDTFENLRKREDINSIFEKYNKHIKSIYDVYSKIGYNKISFYSKECIHINEFKQFLINFAVLGLLISTDQMNWIFNKISKDKQKQSDREGQTYLDYDDFQIALCMLAIFSRFTERSRKLLPSDIDSTNGETIEYFFKFLGLKLPYNKLEMENFINDRRALNMKNLIDLQRKVNVKSYKSGEYVDEEEEKKKEEKKKKMENQRKKKEMEREKSENKENDEEGGEEDENEEDEEEEDEDEENEKKDK